MGLIETLVAFVVLHRKPDDGIALGVISFRWRPVMGSPIALPTVSVRVGTRMPVGASEAKPGRSPLSRERGRGIG